MTPLHIAYLGANAVVAWYLWRRVGLRFGCAMLVLAALLIIYGPAHVSFQVDREINQELHSTVTAALLVMWVFLLIGLELPRWIEPAAFARARRVSAAWDHLPLRPGFAPGTLFRPVAIFVLLLLAIDFIVEGQLGKVISYYSSAGLLEELAQFRWDEGGSRFYLANILVLTLAPFLSMVLLCEAVRAGTAASRPRRLLDLVRDRAARQARNPAEVAGRDLRAPGLLRVLADPLERGSPPPGAGGNRSVPPVDGPALAGGVPGHRARGPALLLLPTRDRDTTGDARGLFRRLPEPAGFPPLGSGSAGCTP